MWVKCQEILGATQKKCVENSGTMEVIRRSFYRTHLCITVQEAYFYLLVWSIGVKSLYFYILLFRLIE